MKGHAYTHNGVGVQQAPAGVPDCLHQDENGERERLWSSPPTRVYIIMYITVCLCVS